MEAMELVRDIVICLVIEYNDLNKSSSGVDEKGSFLGIYLLEGTSDICLWDMGEREKLERL